MDNKTLMAKLGRFCAYRERCQQEVLRKLTEIGASVDQADEVLAELITLGFVNEERFAQLFAGGKFRLKRWGRVKIRRELKMRNLTEYCINQGLDEIEEDEYKKTLQDWIQKKRLDYGKGEDVFVNQKIANFCIQKGYESDLVWEVIGH